MGSGCASVTSTRARGLCPRPSRRASRTSSKRTGFRAQLSDAGEESTERPEPLPGVGASVHRAWLRLATCPVTAFTQWELQKIFKAVILTILGHFLCNFGFRHYLGLFPV